jgi:hypothetical protein
VLDIFLDLFNSASSIASGFLQANPWLTSNPIWLNVIGSAIFGGFLQIRHTIKHGHLRTQTVDANTVMDDVNREARQKEAQNHPMAIRSADSKTMINVYQGAAQGVVNTAHQGYLSVGILKDTPLGQEVLRKSLGVKKGRWQRKKLRRRAAAAGVNVYGGPPPFKTSVR